MSSSSVGGASTPNRWVISIAAFIAQLALGSVYGWSVFLTTVIKDYGVSKPAANLTFSITLLALGVTAGFGGGLLPRFGPRVVASVGGILYGLGVALAGLTTPLHSLFLLYLFYGVIGGIGIGLGYIVPLAMLIRWFPDRRGFITGLAVAGFGLGATLIALIAPAQLKPGGLGLGPTFTYFGIAYLIIVVVAAQFFRRAPDNYAPAGWTPSPVQQATQTRRNFTLQEALRTPRWYVLWLILALNVTAGAALISVASPLATQFTHVEPLVAATIVITISIFNGAGRLFWAWLSDGIGRPFTFVGIFIVGLLSFLAIAQIGPGGFGLLLIPAALVGLCYGGGFGTMPAFTADFFGPQNSGTIYGVMLTAWSAGGIVGPLLIASFTDYHPALYILAAILLISTALPFIARSMLQRQSATEAVAPAGS
jgi:OFA family oxalate/formate antiporter-like MFS transporter